MKTALITTTVNVPAVLSLYRRFDPSGSVKFFVASDIKTPVVDTYNLCTGLGNVELLTVERQKTLNYKCSELIGWGCVQRRNIALLEAVRWGADIIISIDTDNYPLSPNFFHSIDHLFATPYSGMELEGANGWVDPGWLLEPAISHRGMPKRLDRIFCRPAIDRKVGVVACTVIGSCDLSAVDRVAADHTRQPRRYTASSLASGVIVDPAKQWTVFNTQAVAFRRELAPAIAAWSGVGRFDDICASLLAQRIMRHTEQCVYAGAPVVWHEHERSENELIRNIKGEVWGYENIEKVAQELHDWGSDPEKSVLNAVRFFFSSSKVLPEKTKEVALALVEDFAGVL